MKKNVLALSIAAMIGGLGFAGAASAGVIEGSAGTPSAGNTATVGGMQKPTITGFTLAEGGVGHALVVPYYTAQNGNMTVLHLVNTDTKSGKVAKVRFRGASNSDDVLDFQVMLSPGDVWTGAVTKGADGFANLTTGDGTCTIPALQKGVSVPFLAGRLNPNLTGDALASQTREGYVEIFNAADIPSDAIYGKTGDAQSALYTAIKHVGGVAPCTTTAINAALFDKNFDGAVTGDEAAAAKLGLDAPTGGLTADWYIINVPQSTTFSGAATALVGVTTAARAIGNFVAFPQNDAIKIATPELNTADPLLVSKGIAATAKDSTGAWAATDGIPAAVVEAIALDFPDMSTPYYAAASAQAAANQASNLTKALAVSSITNQYAKDASITAKTDWVFSMPTRRYSVALDYSKQTATVPPARVFSSVSGTSTQSPVGTVVAGAVQANPGASGATQFFHTGNTKVVDGKICVDTQGAVFRDREETFKSGIPVFSPSSAKSSRMCGEANVLSFGEGVANPSVLGATVAREDVNSASIYENGWGVLDTTNGGVGLPIMGYSVIKLTNPQVAAGVSGNFGITWPHRFTKVNP